MDHLKNTVAFLAGISLLILLFACPIHAQADNFSIRGEILFSETGVLYVYLVDEKSFATPLSGYRTLILEPNQLEASAGKILFVFDAVPRGRYAIRCFQDVNNDGVLNRGIFGPSEPWGMTWQNKKHPRIPKFEDIVFDLNKDIKYLRIVMK